MSGERPDSDLEWLRLARTPHVGPTTFRRLLSRFGSARAALEALPDMALRGGAAQPLAPAAAELAEAELAAGAAVGARLLRQDWPEYPRPLLEIHNPPPLLWVLGEPNRISPQTVAIVGSRSASANGMRFAAWLSENLAEAGWTVASGLARGIDAAAHHGALSAPNGVTAAAVAGGVDHIYPLENSELRERIIAQGALFSEMPIGYAPKPKHFPRRNRIVSGLSRGVVVVEAAEKSGSLTTARLALDQNREVMAAPGHPMDPRSVGGNRLIREGATLVRSAEDVIEALTQPYQRNTPAQGVLLEASHVTSPPPEALIERLAALLSVEPCPLDELTRMLDAPPGDVSAALLDLELAGRAETHPGGAVSLRSEAS